jgi:spore germination protein KB
MENARINVRQLFAMIVLFAFGTSLVLPVGFVSEQSVWISILLASAGGLVLFLIYDYLYRQFPDLPLSRYIRKIFGNYIGWPVCLLLFVFIIHNDARVLRETGELLVTTALDQTPLFVINALLMMAVIYVLYLGIEVLARTAEIYLIIIIILGVLGNMFVLFSGIVDIFCDNSSLFKQNPVGKEDGFVCTDIQRTSVKPHACCRGHCSWGQYL